MTGENVSSGRERKGNVSHIPLEMTKSIRGKKKRTMEG